MSDIFVSDKRDITNINSKTFEERARELEEIEKFEEKQRELEKKSTYRNFVQLNRQNIHHIIAICNIDKQATRILLFMLENMDKFNALICSYTVFQEQLEISISTVKRAIKILKEQGFIAIYKSGTSNVYVINDDLAWTNHGNKHQYCKFPANVVLTASEQYKQSVKYTNTKILETEKNKEQD